MNRTIATSAAALAAFAASPALAAEGGTTFYLLGSGGPGAAVPPPVEGVYFDHTFYVYDGEASAARDFVVGGRVVADLKATVIANFVTTMFVPTTDFGGGTLAIATTLPLANPEVTASAVLTGPGGRQLGVSRKDDPFVVGDPVVMVAATWAAGENSYVQPSVQVNIPIGEYREDRLGNLAFNRWIVDTSVAMSWHDAEAGWDASAKIGYTFDGMNDYTQYNSGDQFHLEGSVERIFSPQFSLGLQAYYLEQVGDDHGSGASLGAFKGRTVAGGLTAAYNFVLGQTPVTARVRAFKEFDVKNRLDGQAFFVSFSLPISLNLPAG